MTAPAEQAAHSAPLVRPGVWCEAVSTLTGLPGTAMRRDGYAAPSPEAAIRWIRAGARTVVSVLGPNQAGYVLDHWVDGPGSARACARLRRGESCSLTLYPRIQHLTWQARPVRFLRLAEVNGHPPCGRHRRPRRRPCRGRPRDDAPDQAGPRPPGRARPHHDGPGDRQMMPRPAVQGPGPQRTP